MERRERLGSGEMHLRPREISQAADVVRIEVRQDDVPDIGGIEAQPANLVDGGFIRVEHRADVEPRRAEPTAGRFSVPT